MAFLKDGEGNDERQLTDLLADAAGKKDVFVGYFWLFSFVCKMLVYIQGQFWLDKAVGPLCIL